MGASAVGYRRYYAWVALTNRADGVQHDAKATVRRKRIFPFLRVGEMGDVLVDGVRYVSGAWVLQKTDSSATTRGLHWPIVWMGFGMMRKRWCSRKRIFPFLRVGEMGTVISNFVSSIFRKVKST